MTARHKPDVATGSVRTTECVPWPSPRGAAVDPDRCGPAGGARRGGRVSFGRQSALEINRITRVEGLQDALAVLALVALVAAARPLTTGVGAPHPHGV